MSLGSLAFLETVSPGLPLLHTSWWMPCQKCCSPTCSLLQLFSCHPLDPFYPDHKLALHVKKLTESEMLPATGATPFPTMPPVFGSIHHKLGWPSATKLISQASPVYGNAHEGGMSCLGVKTWSMPAKDSNVFISMCLSFITSYLNWCILLTKEIHSHQRSMQEKEAHNIISHLQQNLLHAASLNKAVIFSPVSQCYPLRNTHT